MKYRELIGQAEERLRLAGIEDAKSDAWLLFEYVFKMPRHEYFMKMSDACDSIKDIEDYNKCIITRCGRIPLQHITGCQEFMGFNFKVNENVLIPRQDTELLVEKALKIIEALKKTNENVSVLDMCTGSGCIAISISKLLDVEVTAVDISDKAILVAKENKEKLNARKVSFVESNLFTNFRDNSTGNICKKYDIIVSNPPYIPSSDIEELMCEVKDYEPRLALDGTEDGLLFYRKITEESGEFLNEGGYLLYEIGHNQGEDVSEIMKHNGYVEVSVHKDLAGHNRVIIGRKNH